MTLSPFLLERYFARYEFKARYLLSSSDCESLGMDELVGMASPEALALWQGLKLGYTESQGHPLLREEISRLYTRIAAENVLVAAPEEAIFIAMHTLLAPGDHVIAVAPAYQSLHEIARSIGCTVTEWPLQPDGSRWSLDIDGLEELITPHTRLLVLNFPHNPTGHILSAAELEAVIATAHRHDLTIFSDEMYRLLESSPALRLPPICDVYEKGISLSGLSKSMALPGLRIGWLAAQDAAWVARWLAFKDYTTICSSAPSEILALIALQNKEQILARNLTIIRRNIINAGEFISVHQNLFKWIPPLAGSVAFPLWSGDEPVEQFCQAVLDQRGVMLVPGSLFGYAGNHFRLGLGRSNFAEAVAQVDGYLNQRALI